ncbi:MAG: hypothetical protein ACLQUY_21380 [Ktedonobacterales bacterium]
MLMSRYLLSRVMLSVMPPTVPAPPPPPMPPTLPAAPPPPQRGFLRAYLIGLGVGLIPLVLVMIGIGQVISSSRGGPANSFLSYLFLLGIVLYLAEIIAMIVLLVMSRTRPIGYGLLTMVVISPIVFAVGCTVLFFSIPY